MQDEDGVAGFKPIRACSSSLRLPGICTGLLLQIDMSNSLVVVLVQRLNSYRHKCSRHGGSLRNSFSTFHSTRPQIPKFRSMDLLSCRLRRRHIVVVLLLEKVALDLGILEKLKVALYQASISNALYRHGQSSRLKSLSFRPLWTIAARAGSNKQIIRSPYLAGAHTSPSG